MTELILEMNSTLYPPLPVVAILLFIIAAVVTRRSPTSAPMAMAMAMLSQRRDLAAAVQSWSLNRHETVVRWLDYAALSKREIIEAVGERSWSYSGQDMYAAGWPLYFTRDESVAGVLETEEAHRAELQARTAKPRGDDDDVVAPPVPLPGGLNRLLNLAVLFGSITILPLLFLLLVPGTRESSTSVLVLGAVALVGAGPFVRSVIRVRRTLREHREVAHRDRALRLYPGGRRGRLPGPTVTAASTARRRWRRAGVCTRVDHSGPERRSGRMDRNITRS